MRHKISFQGRSSDTGTSKRTSVRKRLRLLVMSAPLVSLVLSTTVLAGCGAAAKDVAEVKMAPVSGLSDKVRSSPPVVQEAYRFAIANPDILSQLPCYCGCGGVGHEDNLDCFVQDVNADGSVVFDYHAFG